MGLKDVFSRKSSDTPADTPAGPVIAATTFVEARDQTSHVLATVLTERYTEREALAIETDMLDAASTRAHRLAIDLHKVAMLASAGIGSLIQLHNTCQKSGGKLVLCAIDPQVKSMLAVAKLDKLFDMVDTPADARKRLAQ